MSHIVDSCPLTKLAGGLSKLHSADDDAVAWLTNYGGPTGCTRQQLPLLLVKFCKTSKRNSDDRPLQTHL